MQISQITTSLFVDVFQKWKQTAIKITKYQWFSNQCQQLKRALVGTRRAVSALIERPLLQEVALLRTRRAVSALIERPLLQEVALSRTRHAVSLQKINIVKLWIVFWKLENAPRELLTRCIF